MQTNLTQVIQQAETTGYFDTFGGAYHLSARLKEELNKVSQAYLRLKNDTDFQEKMRFIRVHYQGRPTPITPCEKLSRLAGGAHIYLKREDLNHTGAHKINHTMGEALLAKALGKTKLIAETGAGSHGTAVATAAAYFGLKCDIYMGAVDVEKQYANVMRMRILGANVIPVHEGTATLKEAVDSVFKAYENECDSALYAIGTVAGPHPFPSIVRDFQDVIGREAKEQFLSLTGHLPHHVVACVGGGSNAIGLFSAFLEDKEVALYGVEPLGKGTKIGDNAASIAFGKTGILHGCKSKVLLDEQGAVAPAYSLASGLDYPAVGPEHAYLHQVGRVHYVLVDDKACLKAFYDLSRQEGIIPALESAHAVAYGMKLATRLAPHEDILINLSGRGDKDLDFVIGQK